MYYYCIISVIIPDEIILNNSELLLWNEVETMIGSPVIGWVLIMWLYCIVWVYSSSPKPP